MVSGETGMVLMFSVVATEINAFEDLTNDLRGSGWGAGPLLSFSKL